MDIKFRVWDMEHQRLFAFEDIRIIIQNGGWTIMLPERFVGPGQWGAISNKHVIRELFTTRQDINDVDLYAGDIVEYDNIILQIKWDGFGWIGVHWMEDPKSFSIDNDGNYLYDKYEEKINMKDFWYDCEKIGDIHQNPKLLNGGM